jgi:hypothetical protein
MNLVCNHPGANQGIGREKAQNAQKPILCLLRIFAANLAFLAELSSYSFLTRARLGPVLVVVCGLAGVVPGFGQVTISFNNRIPGTVMAPVYSPEPCNPAAQRTGNTPAGYPAGAQSYSGAALSGSGYTAQLFAGPQGTSEEDLQARAPLTAFRTDAPGYVSPVNVLVPFLPGQTVRLQMRAWDNRTNTVTSWGDVLSQPTVARGRSPTWDWSVPVTFPGISPMAGLRSFNLFVPEPSPILFCPPHLVLGVEPGSPVRSNVTYTVTAQDFCDSNLIVTYTPPSGSAFPTGTTTVFCTATNTAGYSDHCSFTVTVWDISQPLDLVLATNASITFCLPETASTALVWRWRKNLIALPDGTNACLTLSDLTMADGGEYDVAIREVSGDRLTMPIRLMLDVTSFPSGADSFQARNLLLGATGVVRETNSAATREPAEPWHADQPGYHSVWYRWRAPADGIATFHTRGSTFDTLLAVYTGQDLTNLVAVASDEDRGGVYTSQVQFNAQAGTDYQIALDGFEGANGVYLLSWSFEETGETVPGIVVPPIGQAVCRGRSAGLSVTADSTNVTYQWLFNGIPMQGETSSTLILSNVQSSNLGPYSVRVSNQYKRVIETTPVPVQIGSSPGVSITGKLFRQYKRCSVVIPELALTLGGGSGAGTNAGGAPPTQCLGLGQYYHGEARRSGGGDRKTSCAAVTLTTMWFGVEPTNSGLLVINTTELGTGLAVYRLQEPDYQFFQVACDFESARLGRKALLRFPVQPETGPHTIYAIMMDVVDWSADPSSTIGADCVLYPEDLQLEYRLEPGDKDKPPRLQITYRSVPCDTCCPFVLEAAGRPDAPSEGWEPIITNSLFCEGFTFVQPITNGLHQLFYRGRFDKCGDPCRPVLESVAPFNLRTRPDPNGWTISP